MSTLEEIVKNPVTIFIDIRENDEKARDGELENAMNIPFESIVDNVDKIKEIKVPIVIFCKAGIRAKKAIDFLESRGVKDLHNGIDLENIKKIMECS